MPDWSKSMQQTYEFYVVDPFTWGDIRKLEHVNTASINRDEYLDTLENASFDCEEILTECYIRIYLITNQNGITEKHPLGTFLVQTPSITFDGKVSRISLDAYSPLIELTNVYPEYGYTIAKGLNIMEQVCAACDNIARTPIVGTSSTKTMFKNFIASSSESWLEYLASAMINANYKFGLDPLGRIMFNPIVKDSELQPVWIYTDDNSSILYPDISEERDLYGIPNVVEVIFSSSTQYFYSRVVNDDPNSEVSTVSRGREVVYRETSPNFEAAPTQDYVDRYARQLLLEKSKLVHKITYKHAYCPVRVGDAVRLNYSRSGFSNITAKVVKQSISCEPGCPVEETAEYITNLWG